MLDACGKHMLQAEHSLDKRETPIWERLQILEMLVSSNDTSLSGGQGLWHNKFGIAVQ